MFNILRHGRKNTLIKKTFLEKNLGIIENINFYQQIDLLVNIDFLCTLGINRGDDLALLLEFIDIH